MYFRLHTLGSEISKCTYVYIHWGQRYLDKGFCNKEVCIVRIVFLQCCGDNHHTLHHLCVLLRCRLLGRSDISPCGRYTHILR